MVIDRRTFMQGAALVSTGGLLSYSADALAFASPTPASQAPQTAAETDAKHVFKVDGWDRSDQLPVEHPTMSSDLTGEEVFIRVNRAWRTAWR